MLTAKRIIEKDGQTAMQRQQKNGVFEQKEMI